MFKRIDHLALHVSDLSKSVKFYTDHFGFDVYFENKLPSGVRIVYMLLGDTMLELIQIPEGKVGFHFCLQTADFDAGIRKLLESGVKMKDAPHYTAPRTEAEQG